MSFVSYNVLVNGQEVGPIIPKRGLRQGDSFSIALRFVCRGALSINS